MNNGAIQRKGKRFYFVTRKGGRQKWISLKTDNLSTATVRARELLVPTTDETEWLHHLSRIGRLADRRLVRQGRKDSIGWDSLLDAYIERSAVKCDKSGKSTFGRWMQILKERVGDVAPGEIAAAEAQKAMSMIAEEYISCRRMLGFFRNCWQSLGLDASIWEMDAAMRRHVNESGKSREFYRRFTMEEVRKVYWGLRENSADLSDMVAIGYLTGLRLSDVVELDTGEVSGDGMTLRIVPNKTRKRKSKPLTIPLVYEAAETIARRIAAVSSADSGAPAPFGVNLENGGRYLFSQENRRRPSRGLCAAFLKCGIVKNGCARASFHSLRATFISMMDEAGVSPHLTDAITGHGGGGMHARYTQPSTAALRNALLSALPPLGNK